MDKEVFEGTIVLEKIARIDKMEEFMAAADYQDTEKAAKLMKEAGIDADTISTVLKKMSDPSDEH